MDKFDIEKMLVRGEWTFAIAFCIFTILAMSAEAHGAKLSSSDKWLFNISILGWMLCFILKGGFK